MCRTKTEQKPNNTRLTWTNPSVAVTYSNTSNRADTWYVCSSRRTCWVPTCDRRGEPWRRTDQNVSMLKRSKICTPTEGSGCPSYTVASSEGPTMNASLPPAQRPARRGRPKKKRYRYKPKTLKDVTQGRPTVYNPEYMNAIRFC